MFLLHVKSFLITHSHPRKTKESAKEKARAKHARAWVCFGLRWKVGNVFFFRAKQLKSDKPHTHTQTQTRLGIACVLCLSLWQSVCYGRQCALSYVSMFIMLCTPPSLPLPPRTSPQSAWHIPLWCAFNCSKILKQFLSSLSLSLSSLSLLLSFSCQRVSEAKLY